MQKISFSSINFSVFCMKNLCKSYTVTFRLLELRGMEGRVCEKVEQGVRGIFVTVHWWPFTGLAGR